MTPWWEGHGQRLFLGDATALAAGLPQRSVSCVVTSPPYYRLRNYGEAGELGAEQDPQEFVDRLVNLFRVLRPALHPTATVWLNLGDSYWDGSDGDGPEWATKGHLLFIPWRVAIALADLGYRPLNVNVWAKPTCNPAPTERRLRCRWEPVFCFAVGPRHYFDLDSVRMPHSLKGRKPYGFHYEGRALAQVTGANPGDVVDLVFDDPEGDFRAWSTTRYPKAHFAVFPPDLPRLAIEAGCPPMVCPTCHAPYQRRRERVGGPSGDHTRDQVGDHSYRESRKGTALESGTSGVASDTNLSERYRKVGYPTHVTTGWDPSCKCGAFGVAPATVLDPFVGTGTTVVEARNLGRAGVGFDLQEKFLGWARDHVEEAASA